MSTIIPKSHANYLFYLSWLSLGSSFYAMYKSYFGLAFVPGGVFITSINYWRNPDYSWRRYVDIVYVHLSMMYQVYRAYNSQYARWYYLTLCIGCSFYPLAVYYHKKNQWLSTFLHGCIHIFGNISNFILYSGYIPK
jgi:hypothetical protein